jgi:hypothetical protein
VWGGKKKFELKWKGMMGRREVNMVTEEEVRKTRRQGRSELCKQETIYGGSSVADPYL